MAAVSDKKNRVLLSTNAVPRHYDISFSVDLENFTFVGDLTVDLELKEASNQIELYAVDIEIPEGSVSYDGQVASKIEHFADKDGLLVLHFPQALSATKEGAELGHLVFKGYKGTLNDRMEGFYRSQYTHSSGEKRYMGVTQFEATDARRAFPCWDEPLIKSRFTVTITADRDLTILSNMPEASRENVGDKSVKVRFQQTPIMSTYLVAWVVGEFTSVSGASKSGIPISIYYTPHGRSNEGDFALDAACRVLDYFEEYYQIPYQLPKLDCIAIPDFSAGAMENWGLVTYRETALLVSADASIASKQRVAYVVAHEFAHQWYGNLVTMEWWRELWLNEGFATFAGQAAVAHCYPQWDMWTGFFSDYVCGALKLDALRSSHPIEVEVATSAQIDEIFDVISYYKGASVIRMLATTIGETAFRDGLRIYLKRHAFKNAVTTDLWDALSETAHTNVSETMSNWVLVTGYPVISVRQSDSDPKKLLLEQKRFLADGSDAEDATIWSMTLNIEVSTSSGAKETLLVPFNTRTLEVTLPEAQPAWILVNSGQSALGRVAYSGPLASALGQALSRGEITNPVNRLGLINDAFALSKAGVMLTSSALSLLRGFSQETNFRVFSVAAAGIETIARIWAHEKGVAQEINKLIWEVFYPQLQRLTWDKVAGEDEENPMFRSLVIRALVSAGHPEVLAHAQSIFKKALESHSKDQTTPLIANIPVDIRSPIYLAHLRSDDSAAFDHLLDIFVNGSSDHAERLKALGVAASTKDLSQLDRLLKMALSGSEIRPQDAFLVFAYLDGIPSSKRAWSFVKENWPKVEEMFRGSLISRIITGSFSQCLGQEIIDDVNAFFASHPCPPAERAIAQTCEGILANTKWFNAHLNDVASFFHATIESPSTILQ